MGSGAEPPSCECYRRDVFLFTPLWIGPGAALVRRNVAGGPSNGAEIGRYRFPGATDQNARICRVRYYSAFARAGGPNAEIDVETRTSNDFDFRRELLEGRAELLTKADRLPTYCTEASKRTSYFYNQFSGKLVGNYENRAESHPVKEWRLTTFKFIIDTYEILSNEGIAEVAWGDLPTTWGKVYNWFHVGIKDPRGGSRSI